MRLTTQNHDRDSADATYVYPVVSRRAQGVSVGINLNPNDACNWRCVYCQVPGLTMGKGPTIDLDQLEEELRLLLDDVVHGDFMTRVVPEGSRRINDIAFSGNGESTSSPNFCAAVKTVLAVRSEYEALRETKMVLITNGSLIHLGDARTGIAKLAAANGEVWFKVDSATDAGIEDINSSRLGQEHQERNLRLCAELAPTWLQTMMLRRSGLDPSEAERAAYLDLIERLVADKIPLQGVLLYGLARESHQPEAESLSALSQEWMDDFALEIRARGLEVRVSL
ncbi:MAG: wyosine [tRNA(Phe)-imidazoG37] synthetase (radical SAM superfamily) [Planctomycetota bacterium]|jgi:wyosine [tRNA(Phe)-imidazoG37] synthetase (radical SAM superfamily)